MTESDNKTPHNASQYDWNVRRTIPFYETIHRETIDLVQAVKPDVTRWLDTGCGTGRLIELALPRFPDTHFDLADPSTAMLQQCKMRLSKIGQQRVTVLPPLRSEELTSSLRDESYQVLTAIQCHHYLSTERREQAVKSCYKMVDYGGVFICSENITCATDKGTQIGLERWGSWQRDAGRSLSDVQNHLKRFKVDYFPITVVQHLKLLESVGFQTVEIFWFSRMQASFYAIKGDVGQ